MPKQPPRDSIYAAPRDMIVDFVFDESVTQVFPDMIRRSVPGYDAVVALTGLFAERYAQAHSHCYDLGCSLGATTLAMRRRIAVEACRVIAVDNSTFMTERCRENLSAESSDVPVDVVCADIRDVEIQRASLVAINFTLQFIERDQRLSLLQGVANGMLPGGVLVLSEKVTFDDRDAQQFHQEMHLGFKRANDYSDMEISQKRAALERVLVPDSIDTHLARLRSAGFRQAHLWYQCFNFVSLAAFR